MKYPGWIILGLSILLVIVTYKLLQEKHKGDNYVNQYENIIHKRDSIISDIKKRNNFVQDSLTQLLNINHAEEKALNTAIKNNDNDFKNKRAFANNLSLDSAIELRTTLRRQYRSIYRY